MTCACIVTPWAILSDDMGLGFEKGKFVIPVTRGSVSTICFVPCAGIDDETGQVPSWCEEVSLNDFAAFDWAAFSNIQTLGESKVDVLANNNTITNVLPGEVMVGDVVTIGGQTNEVVSVGESEEVVLCKDIWKRKGSQRKIRTTKVPKLFGKLVEIQNSKIEQYVDVNFTLVNVDKNNHGTLKCTYRQGGFNCFGFSVYELFGF